MTLDAPIHLDCHIWLQKRALHLPHLAVACFTSETALLDMSAMGEIGVVGNRVNLDPGDSVLTLDELRDFSLFQVVGFQIKVAAAADFYVGDPSSSAAFNILMAVFASKAQFFHVLLVVILNGLAVFRFPVVNPTKRSYQSQESAHPDSAHFRTPDRVARFSGKRFQLPDSNYGE